MGNFKKAWVIAVLRAHGVKVEWKKDSAWRDLTPECKAEFRTINLHWHDLRHEYASRLVERGVPLAQVRDLLGHASITTTERYDNQKLENLQDATARLEAGKVFVPGDPSTDDDATVCQVFVKNDRSAAPSRESELADETPPNELMESGLEGWYRYGDSNPGPVAENHVS